MPFLAEGVSAARVAISPAPPATSAEEVVSGLFAMLGIDVEKTSAEFESDRGMRFGRVILAG